jgi:hypothetical protein
MRGTRAAGSGQADDGRQVAPRAGRVPVWEKTMQAADQQTSFVVVYYSRFGVLKQLAELVAEGVRRVDGATDARSRPLRPRALPSGRWWC